MSAALPHAAQCLGRGPASAGRSPSAGAGTLHSSGWAHEPRARRVIRAVVSLLNFPGGAAVAGAFQLHSGQRRLDAAPSAAINIITHLPSESSGGFDGRDAPQTLRLATAGTTNAALESIRHVAGSATHERRRYPGMTIGAGHRARAAGGSPYLSKAQLTGVSAPALLDRRA